MALYKCVYYYYNILTADRQPRLSRLQGLTAVKQTTVNDLEPCGVMNEQRYKQDHLLQGQDQYPRTTDCSPLRSIIAKVSYSQTVTLTLTLTLTLTHTHTHTPV